jgi:hypothetical protein
MRASRRARSSTSTARLACGGARASSRVVVGTIVQLSRFDRGAKQHLQRRRWHAGRGADRRRIARAWQQDMDLSLRAYLQGWRFVFLYDVTCVNELPASYDAYRKQQHRWSCGPMQLWRKATAAVWQSNISWAQKLYLNVFFFGTRLFATHVVSFVFYCTLVPIAVMTPEVRIPFWALVYMPLLITCSTVAFTPGCASAARLLAALVCSSRMRGCRVHHLNITPPVTQRLGVHRRVRALRKCHVRRQAGRHALRPARAV